MKIIIVIALMAAVFQTHCNAGQSSLCDSYPELCDQDHCNAGESSLCDSYPELCDQEQCEDFTSGSMDKRREGYDNPRPAPVNNFVVEEEKISCSSDVVYDNGIIYERGQVLYKADVKAFVGSEIVCAGNIAWVDHNDRLFKNGVFLGNGVASAENTVKGNIVWWDKEGQYYIDNETISVKKYSTVKILQGGHLVWQDKLGEWVFGTPIPNAKTPYGDKTINGQKTENWTIEVKWRRINRKLYFANDMGGTSTDISVQFDGDRGIAFWTDTEGTIHIFPPNSK